MLYKLAHVLRERCPWLFDLLERVNGWLFAMRYRKGLREVNAILSTNSTEYTVVRATEKNVDALERFFVDQPESAFEYFRPHGFDENTLRRLARNKGFLSFLVMKEETVVGYFFLRCYVMGKCYRGYMTDFRWYRKGVNRLMGNVSTEMAEALGIPMFGSINKKNIASLKSAEAVNEIKVLRELEDGDMLVEYLPKNNKE